MIWFKFISVNIVFKGCAIDLIRCSKMGRHNFGQLGTTDGAVKAKLGFRWHHHGAPKAKLGFRWHHHGARKAKFSCLTYLKSIYLKIAAVANKNVMWEWQKSFAFVVKQKYWQNLTKFHNLFFNTIDHWRSICKFFRAEWEKPDIFPRADNVLFC